MDGSPNVYCIHESRARVRLVAIRAAISVKKAGKSAVLKRKRLFMSSSHQNALPINKSSLKLTSKTIYICIECDKKAMRRVTGPCRLGDGTVVPELERFHCMVCGSDFFDLPAMKAIREFRESLKRKPAQTGRSRKTSSAIYSTL
jgi:hypothetical protein